MFGGTGSIAVAAATVEARIAVCITVDSSLTSGDCSIAVGQLGNSVWAHAKTERDQVTLATVTVAKVDADGHVGENATFPFPATVGRRSTRPGGAVVVVTVLIRGTFTCGAVP